MKTMATMTFRIKEDAMKVEVETITRTNRYGSKDKDRASTIIVECCQEMSQAFKNEWIELSEDATFTVEASFGKTDWDGHEGSLQTIRFCPFCGQTIEIVQGKHTELVEKITTRTEIVNKTDSTWEVQ